MVLLVEIVTVLLEEAVEAVGVLVQQLLPLVVLLFLFL
jgi:hypothetical protein